MGTTRIGATVNKLPSMTRQADAESCDVNNIMKRYEKTGILPPYTNPGFFADVSTFGDFHAVTEVVRQTNEIFMQLPAQLRFDFGNDVANFVNWATDPANSGELQKLLDGAEQAPVAPPQADEPAGETPVGS